MKALVLALAGCVASACFGIGASQEWVANFVSNYVAKTSAAVADGITTKVEDGKTVLTANAGTGNETRLSYEPFTDAALMATNRTSSAGAVTNGTIFVWNGGNKYINPVGTITATATNLVYNGVYSTRVNGYDRFAGLFDVVGLTIQASKSHSITNSVEVN